MKIGTIYKIAFLLVLPVFLASPVCAQAVRDWDLSHPPTSAALFGKGTVSTNLYERDMAVSPDGQEIFYTLQSPQGVFSTIMHMQKNQSGKWSPPEVASFSGQYSDMEPAFSKNGETLFFVSNRSLGGDTIKDFDIWYVRKTNMGWKNPVNLGAPVNTPENEFYPSVAANGNLYYTANYPGGKGKEDIWMAKRENESYANPIVLDSPVNSVLYEFNAFIDPEEKYIIFTSYGRKDDAGRGDLYICFKNKEGLWTQAKNLAIVNSKKLDYCPFVSFDKKIFFFTSEKNALKEKFTGQPATYKVLADSYRGIMNGQANIYWISLDHLFSSLPKGKD